MLLCVLLRAASDLCFTVTIRSVNKKLLTLCIRLIQTDWYSNELLFIQGDSTVKMSMNILTAVCVCVCVSE